MKKAFRVFYETRNKTSSILLLSEDKSTIDIYLSQKDINYKLNDIRCRTTIVEEVPLTNIMLNELSVPELSYLIGK
ncbi:hypothetical protein EBB07_28365 [Paenibacillaceae bacterium]|nr:hypothetical protein EBB07_28365 [Paenibacillaceae bacterium]